MIMETTTDKHEKFCFVNETKTSWLAVLFLTGLEDLDSTMGEKLKTQAEKRELCSTNLLDLALFGEGHGWD